MKNLMLFAAMLAATVSVVAQDKFTYNDIARGKFSQKTVSGVRSMNDGEHYTVLSGNVLVKYNYLSGQAVDTVYNGAGQSPIYDYRFNPDESKLLLRVNSRPLYRRSHLSDYVVYNLSSGRSMPLTGLSDVRVVIFSPVEDKVAFVQENNIYIKDLSDGSQVKVTADGEMNRIINGVPDWVYEEEFYLYDALRWSPDGQRIAFLRFDETQVKEHTMQFFTDTGAALETESIADPLYPRQFTFKYPKAGERNSVVELYSYELAAAKTTRIDVGAEQDQYVPYFEWTPHGRLYFFRLNRLQNHLEIILADEAGSPRVIYNEKSPKYIDEISLNTITFLPDSKRFIIRNETTTGFMHLYMYSLDEGLLYPITSGEWEVTELLHATDKRIWYMSNETSSLRNNLYTIDLKGKNKKRLTGQDGTYRILPSAGVKYYISYFSNTSTPNTVTLHNGAGKYIRTLEDNAALKNYIDNIGLPRKEFFTLPVNHQGTLYNLNCYIVKPSDFDPAEKYPLLLTQYSGPGSQEVRDRWSIDWEDALVQQGYIIACVDPRGTGRLGEDFKKLTYGRMGDMEVQDQAEFALELAKRPYIDEDRMGIYGWSYGGFMSLNCILHHPDLFKMAISVAPVTSWRYYDSVYTERVNGLPEPKGGAYDEFSPLGHAAKLEGNLLLIHGTGDDNVHVQNTYRMAHELVRHGRRFDMMIYTDDNHSMAPFGKVHIRQKMVDYCIENL